MFSHSAIEQKVVLCQGQAIKNISDFSHPHVNVIVWETDENVEQTLQRSAKSLRMNLSLLCRLSRILLILRWCLLQTGSVSSLNQPTCGDPITSSAEVKVSVCSEFTVSHLEFISGLFLLFSFPLPKSLLPVSHVGKVIHSFGRWKCGQFPPVLSGVFLFPGILISI